MSIARKLKRKKRPKTPRCPKCKRKLTYHEGKNVWICESTECCYVRYVGEVVEE